MKKYDVVIDDNGELKTVVLFGERQKDVKGVAGFIAIKSESTVNHPTPEILARALLEKGVDVVAFYASCEVIRAELEAKENELIANGDEAALKRKARRDEQARIAAENKAKAEAKKARDAKKNGK